MLDYLRPVIDRAVREIANEPISEQEDVAAMVGAAVNVFTLQDAKKYEIVSVEQKFQVPLPGSFFTIYGTTDLLFRDSAGLLVAADWKTVSGFDKDVLERYEVGWQKKIYLWATGAQKFLYRLIKKPEMSDPTYGLSCREITYTVQDRGKLEEEVEHHLYLATQIYDQYGYFGKSWLTNAPHACRAYGRECPHKRTCVAHGGTAPAKNPFKREINNSGINALMLCPERYRQTLLAEESGTKDIEGTSATRLGTAFHHAMEKIYSALMKYQERSMGAPPVTGDVQTSQLKVA